jgi:gas vesicle protein
MSDEHRTSDMLVAFGAGALLGAAAALLLAPKSGAETRRELGELAENALERGRSATERAREKTREVTDRAREKTREAAETAGEFVRDQKERVGHAIHEGKEAYLREAAKR